MSQRLAGSSLSSYLFDNVIYGYLELGNRDLVIHKISSSEKVCLLVSYVGGMDYKSSKNPKTAYH